ncbi:MAG: FkbM family methyltransferase [Roseovarius sp.]|nr:FkbM family methyltransferase [Roseovarius sp.]
MWPMFYRFLLSVEKKAAKLQGKGWAPTTLQKEFAAAVSLLTSGNPQICIDIGGNKGAYTQEILRSFPKCRIVIFEPAKFNAGILFEKFGTNSNVVIEQTGVSNKVGCATLFSDEDGSGLASLTKRRLDHFGIEFNHMESIGTIRFEDYWKKKTWFGEDRYFEDGH